MPVAGSAENITLLSSPAGPASDVGAGKVKDEDTVQISVESFYEGLHGKLFFVLSFDAQKYKNMESCSTIS